MRRLIPRRSVAVQDASCNVFNIKITPPRELPAWSVETRRAPSGHYGDARGYGHTTAAMHDMSTPSPP